MMVVGPGEGDRWLKESLENKLKLVDDMVICGNNTDGKTEKIIKEKGCWFYRDDREWGVHQPDIKNDLLARVIKLKPDWILPSDADEIYDRNFTRDAAEELASTNAISYYFGIINLWNDEDHYRQDLSFPNIRFFRFREDLPRTFERKRVHCGLAPAVFYNYGWQSPYIVKHYGLMLPKDRARKTKRYNKYDPNAQFKGKEYYDKIKEDPQPLVFKEDEWHERMKKDVEKNFTHQSKKFI